MSETVLLWDIDGTLTRTPGLGVRAFAAAVESVTGRPIVSQRYDFGGKTDPLIAVELLEALHIDEPWSLVPLVLAEVERRYSELLPELRSSIVTLPGVVDLLVTCASSVGTQTVVTGNIEVAARCKLEASGLHGHLELTRGAYGSDHADRRELVRLALRRVARFHDIDPSSTWVIGDTPRDAACAHANGVRCLLVATGTFTVEHLETVGADAVLPDLSDTGRVLELFGV